LIGTNYLYESFDRGDTLQVIGGTLPLGLGPTLFDVPVDQYGPVTAMAYGGRSGGQNNGDVAYVGAGGVHPLRIQRPGELYLRTEANGSFKVMQGYRGDIPLDIALDPENWRTAYVVDSNNVYMVTGAGTNAESWTQIDGPQPGNLRTVELIKVPAQGNVQA